MEMQRLPIALTIINLVILAFIVASGATSAAQSVPEIIRARAIEVVDDDHLIRAQINVESNGEVVFRLRDAKGTIRVKLGAAADGSGLVLLDDSTEPGVHILAKRNGTSLTLTGKSGTKRVIEP